VVSRHICPCCESVFTDTDVLEYLRKREFMKAHQRGIKKLEKRLKFFRKWIAPLVLGFFLVYGVKLAQYQKVVLIYFGLVIIFVLCFVALDFYIAGKKDKLDREFELLNR
jgi:hypothetical protein